MLYFVHITRLWNHKILNNISQRYSQYLLQNYNVENYFIHFDMFVVIVFVNIVNIEQIRD